MNYLENKIPPPLVAIIFAVGIICIAKVMPVAELNLMMKYIVVALLLICAVYFLLSGASGFRRAKTTVNPLKPESASSLVTSGVYQITRNPMYLGFVFILCALTVYLGSLFGFVFVVLYMAYIHRFQIRPEEKALLRIFGQRFIDYKIRVRPWL